MRHGSFYIHGKNPPSVGLGEVRSHVEGLDLRSEGTVATKTTTLAGPEKKPGSGLKNMSCPPFFGKQTKPNQTKPTNKQTNKQSNKQTNKPTDQPTNQQTNKQTNKQTNIFIRTFHLTILQLWVHPN